MAETARTEAAPKAREAGDQACALWHLTSSEISRDVARDRLWAGVNQTAPTRTVVLENVGSLPAYPHKNEKNEFQPIRKRGQALGDERNARP